MEVLFALIIGGVVGALIGRNRKIGAGWGALLGAVLGLIGWIIALCSKKNTNVDYVDMTKE